MPIKIPNTLSGIETTTFWLVAKGNNTATIFPRPFNYSPINHTFDIKQYELSAVSLYKTQISKSLCTLPIAHSSYII